MKLTGVELIPGGSANNLVLSFRDPKRLQPYNVKKITGLDADEIVARFYAAPGNSLTKFFNLSVQKRDLSLTIELNPNFTNKTFSSLRDDLYKMISSTRTGLIKVVFKNGETNVAAISGHITKLETDQFEKTQEVTLNISCTSGDTLLRALEDVDIPVAGVSPANTVITDNLSTAPHGFAFQIAFLNALPRFTITDADDSAIFFEVAPVDGFQQYDLLAFSSDPTDKYALILRGATPIHIADKIVRSVWPIIFPGVNRFTCLNADKLEWVSISHRPTYWGV